MNKKPNKTTQKIAIRGSGGKSKSKSRTPVEANDTVASNVRASIIDLLGEGVIGGLLNGAKSIYIDKVPLVSEDGTYSYNNVDWDFRNGTQDQTVMPKYNTIQTPFNVNVECKATNPVTFAVQSNDNDYVKVIMEFPSLTSTNVSNGDRNGATVKFKFMMSYTRADGTVVSMQDVIPEGAQDAVITISQKQNSTWYKSFLIKMPKGNSKYRIRCVRLSADETSSYVQNRTIVNSYIEILNTPFNYPNSALIGITVNAEDFGNSIPERAYLVGGLYIKIPSNYNQDENKYVGYWDGTFKLAVSSNPAWILFDLMTNERYGLGKFVQAHMFNLGALYQIGVYCDGLVDDGKGGKEKRFAINTVIAGRDEAFNIISDIVSTFRGMIFWSGGMVNVIQDKPKDPSFLISNSNVVDGEFHYQGSSRKDRPSIALVTWNNPDDYFERHIEYVEDPESISRFGSRQVEVTAFGCTSQGQAHRLGLWTLYTARYETDLISFQMTQEAAFLMPGDICNLQDKYRAGKKNSGRTVNVTSNSIELDVEIDIKPNSFIQVVMGDGTFVERDILESGTTKIVTFLEPLESLPVKGAVYLITEPDLKPNMVRVISVSYDSTKNLYNVVVLQYNPSKFAAIDEGAVLQQDITTNIDPTNYKPSNMVITETTYLSSPGNLSVKLIVSWSGRSPEYVFSWRRVDNDDNIWHTETIKGGQQTEILNVAENGQYDFQVYGIAASGIHTELLQGTHSVSGTATPPSEPTQLTAIGDYRSIILNWANPSSVDLDHIDIFVAKEDDFSKATLLISISANMYTHTGLDDLETRYYWLKAVNKRGMSSQLNSTIGTKATTTEVTSYLNGKITESELGKDLVDKIESPDLSAVENQISDLDTKVNDLNTSLSEDINNLSGFVADKVDNLTQIYNQQSVKISEHDTAIKSNSQNIAAVGKTVTDISGKLEVVETNISSLKTDITNTNKKVSANASAIGALQTSVSDIDGKIVAQSSDITSLKSGLTNAEKNITTNATGISNLNTKVTEQDGKITSQGTAITKIESDLSNAKTNIGANSTAISSLNTKVTNQDNTISSQGSSITAIQSKLTTDLANLFDNPNADPNQSSGFIGRPIVSTPTVLSGVHLANVYKLTSRDNTAKIIPVVGGDTYNFSLYCATDDTTAPTINLGFQVLDKDQKTIGWVSAASRVNGSDRLTWIKISGALTLVKNAAYARIWCQLNYSTNTSHWYVGGISVVNASIYNIMKPQMDITANAVTELGTKVEETADQVTAQGSSITNINATLARRTSFKIKSYGAGSNTGAAGLYDQSNNRIANFGRSYNLIVFSVASNGTVSATRTVYDVYGTGSTAANALITAISDIPHGTYVAIGTIDEPNRAKSLLYDAIESIGGTRETLNKLVYRSAYILLGQKGLAKGSGVELFSTTGDNTNAWVETTVDFVNGVMSNLGGATGATQISGGFASSIQSIDTKVTQQGEKVTAMSTKVDSLSTDVNGVKGDISSVKTSVSNVEKNVSTMQSTVNSKIQDMEATVSSNAQTVADISGKVSSMWTIKTQITSGGKTYVSGIGLSMDSTGSSQFLVQADRFALMNTGTGGTTTPFVIDSGNTYINSAMIKKASISSAMIGNEIQSDNYVAGKLGWILKKDGTFEINGSNNGSGRVLINNEGVKVYDENGTIRVKLGKLY